MKSGGYCRVDVPVWKKPPQVLNEGETVRELWSLCSYEFAGHHYQDVGDCLNEWKQKQLQVLNEGENSERIVKSMLLRVA